MNINLTLLLLPKVNLPRSGVVICTITIDEFDSAVELPLSISEQLITVPFRSAVALV